MKEKLMTLPLVQLKEIAKEQGLKITGLKKEQICEKLAELHEKITLMEKEKEKIAQSQNESIKTQKLISKNGQENGTIDNAEECSEKSIEKNNDKLSNDIPSNRGDDVNGILEIINESGFGFVRCENFLPGADDVYVSQYFIRKYNLKTGDILVGYSKIKQPTEKFPALLHIDTVNGFPVDEIIHRPNFEKLTPIFPNKRIVLQKNNDNAFTAIRMVDLISPIGKGQRGLIVSPPKAGKTTLLKMIAKSILKYNEDMHLIILLIDERPEEVTDMKEEVHGKNVDIIYSTFDEVPERHKRVAEMVIERAKRLVEQKKDVIILLDSITRLTRAYNLIVPASGRTLSGGLDPASLHMPKRFFGAARNIKEGGSLTILATALIDTGSRMDDVIYEEFKGTGNMELVLNRKLQERRVFPAIDIVKSGTRREDLLITKEEKEALDIIHRMANDQKNEEATEKIIDLFDKTQSNTEFENMIAKLRD